MELGATVCTPRSPRCDDCPLDEFCTARAQAATDTIPARRSARPVPRASYAAAVALDPRGQTVLVKRPKTGLWAGLWEFPGSVLDDDSAGLADAEAAAVRRLAGLGIAGEAVARLAAVKHAFSHLRATYYPVVVRVGDEEVSGGASHEGPETVRVDPGRLEEWALPAAQRRIGGGSWVGG